LSSPVGGIASNDPIHYGTSFCENIAWCWACTTACDSSCILFVKRTALESCMVSDAMSILSRTALKCVVNLGSTVDAMPLQLAISNASSLRRVQRSAHLSFAPGSGSQQGRINAILVNAELRTIFAMKVISRYPTPGSKMRPPTTWSEKSASAEGESTPVEISSK